MSKIFGYIIAGFTVIVTILSAVVHSLRKDNKQLTDTVKDNKATQSAQEQIQAIANKPKAEVSPIKPESGIIKHLCITFTVIACLSACVARPIATPALYIVPKPNFSDLNYFYTANPQGWCFNYDNFDNLTKQLDWTKYAIDSYEQQIHIYMEFRNGKNK